MKFNQIGSTCSRGSHNLESESGPYVLRTLLTNLPLSVEGCTDDIHISCVEFLDQNLYVGTSASELLHFVQIPSDTQDQEGLPSYILASRILPAFDETPATNRPGVQQILLLPSVSKACILCNWTVTFYSLPELSPVFGSTQIRPCNWIGGVDLNKDPKTDPTENNPPSVTVLVSLNKKIKVIKISETPRGLKTIDFPGSLISIRRDSYACVADDRSYALLDIDRLLKIPLFSISSLNDSNSAKNCGQIEKISGNVARKPSRGVSSGHIMTSALSVSQAHSRSSSLGAFMSSKSFKNPSHNTSAECFTAETQDENLGQDLPSFTSNNIQNNLQSPQNRSTSSHQIPPSETSEQDTVSQMHLAPPGFLKPHILSPTTQEFLLVTGTSQHDPGVGMFVNLEGDPTRSTLEFETYPYEVVVDGRGVGVDPTPRNSEDEEEGFVLASMTLNDNEILHGIEIQRWDLDPGDVNSEKYWLNMPISSLANNSSSSIGLRSVVDTGEVYFGEVVDKLSLKRFQPIGSKPTMNASSYPLQDILKSPSAISQKQLSAENYVFENDDKRSLEERDFARQFGHVKSRIVVWSGNSIWWAVRNPLVLRLDFSVPEILGSPEQNDILITSQYRQRLVDIVTLLRGREAKTETEYLSHGYVRQRAGLSLFLNSLNAVPDPPSEHECLVTEDALLEGGLDPRVVISLIPFLRNEIDEGQNGIWVHGGIKDIAENFVRFNFSEGTDELEKILISDQTLLLLKRYLTAWRKNKGFGSILNENEVFRSVDASLLVVLLRLDRLGSLDPSDVMSIRKELYDLVDHGVDCFERAITLLESENRLYALSRLYQSRKMAGKVLATWRRILEGEIDFGADFVDGEQKVLNYLNKLDDYSLVQEYGVWLATRNSKLGVQVFAENRSQVKFEPLQVLQILRDRAPGAVKDYLEYLVFHKNHDEYINELIAYYLDIVINKLEESKETRFVLVKSYESYRALCLPKPTYYEFITENAIDEDWWHSRIRLLELLGVGQASSSENDFNNILERIEPYNQELIPESIILDGRRANHDKALRLLTHGLGDYDTAINYCVLGGSSIFHPISGPTPRENLPTRDQQTKLFGVLLSEFLLIDDVSDCVEQTSGLLERFGGMFDVEYVLKVIPDTWSVDLVSGFLLNAIRQIVRERRETLIVKALSGAENLKTNAEYIGKISTAGVSIQT